MNDRGETGENRMTHITNLKDGNTLYREVQLDNKILNLTSNHFETKILNCSMLNSVNGDSSYCQSSRCDNSHFKSSQSET